MAVLNVFDVTYREGGTFQQDDIIQETTDIYQVETDDVQEPKVNILAGVGVDLFDVHPEFPLLIARKFNIRYDPRKRTTFFVEIFYTNQRDREEPEEEDPLDRQIRVRWRSQTYQQFVWKDRNGEGIVNSAGEFFEDTPSIDDTRWIVQIESNQSVVPTWVLSFPNKVNDSAVTIDNVSFDAETLKMQQLNISEKLYKNDIEYRRVTYDLHYRPETWALEILDRGYHEIDPTDQIMVPILIPFTDGAGNFLPSTDKTRRRPTAPWPLDGNGGAITSDPPQPGEQIFQTFNVYNTADFSSLPGVT